MILNQDVEFELYVAGSASGQIVKKKYRGAWLIVDNGYIQWPTCIPPLKEVTTYAELRWSKWLESMRKDVECCFGILKGRWGLSSDFDFNVANLLCINVDGAS